MVNVPELATQILAGICVVIFSIIAYGAVQWFRNVRKLIAYTAKQLANDGNGSWRSSVDKRLTAIEIALPNVTPKPEDPSRPPLER